MVLGRRAEVLAAAEEINAGLPEPVVTAEPADLTKPAQVQDLADRLTAGAPVDVLVNNAGGTFGGSGAGLARVADLTAPEAGWTTGQILQVNGGMLLGRG